MRNRDKRLATRRRQEQEYRDKVLIHVNKRVDPIEEATLIELPTRETKELVPVLPITPEIAIPAIPRGSLPCYHPNPKNSNIPLVCLAYGIGVVGLCINAWFAWNRGIELPDKVIMSSLGFLTESTMFFLPAQASSLWKGNRYAAFLLSVAVYILFFSFAVYNSLGFASVNLTDRATVKAERITPAVSDAQRRLDTLSASRASECQKRGPLCRQLEKEEQEVSKALTEARREVSATSDPQITSAAKLIAWVTLDRFHPSADDFAMLRLLLLTLLPQLGGLVLMVAKRV
jgi:hypothetical protein